ncbi:MoxR family ATPase [Verrucomicrobiaceae bacterium R5-34]|uniref:MoxR family ATPase n=1 Tax=Oceaniferula flava TaxID=2800421 RepID=A0AAE2SDV1_9BACT|nr:MoxR family ATPase [Oceaniferula flavus]MBK1830809.1 MoxR family ATPase [Verrucomicrobiaceae bacterium R5-34]MBK1856456.1 MoxR family ATPase [Oceaniferula flavus]MBM1137763.1 MoxR family ATPase [Oceaniferula flavus]
MNNQELSDNIAASCQWIPKVKEEMGKVLVGQAELVDRLIVGLLCKGHILLEGVPGLAKTLAIKALSGCLNTNFSRIQFTPDLLPSDLVGTMIYNPREATFSAKLGPIFSNIILADEINRAPAKVQSALLEAMQERQVTIGDSTYKLPDPFLVLATQNPIDQEGTYQLPEAQLDRFLLKVTVSYPSREDELTILDRMATSEPIYETKPVVSVEEITQSIQLVNSVYIDPAVRKYIVELVHTTRFPAKVDTGLKNLIRAGASPRATINLALAARAKAFMAGRSFVTPQDIKDLGHDVLRHRILPSYEAEAEDITTDALVDRILSRVPVP